MVATRERERSDGTGSEAMESVIINVTVLRHDADDQGEPRPHTYEVPLVAGMSALDVLNYIYERVDGSLAFYQHAACRQAVCGKCTLLVNDKPVLACQVVASGDMTVASLPGTRVIRDLVYART